MRIDAGRDHVGGELFAALENDACCAAVLDEDFANRRFGADFDAGFSRCAGDGVRNGAGAATAEAPGAESAVDFAHIVMEKNVGGAGRADAEKCADDAGGGHGGFENVGFKPLVEEIGGAHGHKLDEGVALVGREFAETLQQEVELLEIARIESSGVGGNHGEHGLHEAAHRRHHFREFVVGFGVEAGVAANVADGFGVVVHAPEVVAAGHGREGAVEREDFQAVAREIEFADDFRAKKRDEVRTCGKKKTGEYFFSDSGATEDVAAFEYDDFFPGFGEIGGVDQTVVTAADDDNIVVLTHGAGLRYDSREKWAAMTTHFTGRRDEAQALQRR